MSGGSYDYLYIKDGLGEDGALGQFAEMRADIVSRYAESDYREAVADMDLAIQCMGVANGLFRRLGAVMHAVEWAQSGDYSDGQAAEALREYAKKGDE